MMLDLLVISDELASGIYEIRNIFDHIKIIRSGFRYDVAIDRTISNEMLNNTKCILFFRSRSVLDYKLAQLCKKLNKPVFFFIDDDFLGLKDDYGINGAGIWRGRKSALKKMLSLVDAIISPNCLLSEKYAKIGNIKRKVKIDTLVDSDTLLKNFNYEKNRIVLYINDGSIDMFEKYLKPAIKRLGELRPNIFQIDLLSLRPNCDDITGVKINYISHMTYSQFRNFMYQSPYYIGLAPLDNMGFNQYKYFNKYIEYTRAGILGIYSNCPLYSQVVSNRVNGMLVDNTADDWANAVLYCYDHPEEHDKYLRKAQSVISDQFNKDSICNCLIKGLPELFESDKSKKCSEAVIIYIKIIHYWSRVRERSFLCYKYFKKGGIKGVMVALEHRRERNKEKIQ